MELALDVALRKAGQEIGLLRSQLAAAQAGAREALGLVREAGDALLLGHPGSAREAIQRAAVVLYRAGGES